MTDEFENSDSEMETDEVVTSDEETTTDDSKDELSDREKQFLARAKKAEGKLKEVKTSISEPKPDLKKPKTEQGVPTLEDMALLSQGHSLEEMEIITKVATLEGISKTDAAKSDFVVSKIGSMRQEAQVKSNSLPASKGSAPAQRAKTVGNMTDEEHRAYAESKLANATNS